MVRQHRRRHTEDGPVTVVAEFSVQQPENAASLAGALGDAIAENLSRCLGFLTCTLMVSADSCLLIAATRWACEDAWLAASGHGDLPWLRLQESDATLTARLAEDGGALLRVNVFHEVETLSTLVPTSPLRTETTARVSHEATA